MTKSASFTHDDYRDILRCGLAAGFRFAGFDERGSSGKLCLLRHDCDNDLTAAAAMADIEANEGVKSTHFLMLRSAMYNLLAPENLKLARRIVEQGHWIGLHFDTSVLSGDKMEITTEVDRQREMIEHELRCPVQATSFHQPDQRILQGGLDLHCVNTYDPRDMMGIHYTSDSNLSFRGGEPRDLFANGSHRKIQILIHPEWWTREPMPLDHKWAAMLGNNIGLMQKSLLEREKSYTRRHVVTIEAPKDATDV